MARYSLARSAAEDLTNTYGYLAARNPQAADRLFERLHAKLELLAETPSIGRDRSDLRPRLRSFIVHPYVIFYRPIDDGIEIARILHGRRDLPRLIRREAR